MTETEQRRYLKDLINEVGEDLLDRSDCWPEDWDSLELRWLAAKAFTHEAPDPKEPRTVRHRYRKFRNEVNVNQLY